MDTSGRPKEISSIVRDSSEAQVSPQETRCCLLQSYEQQQNNQKNIFTSIADESFTSCCVMKCKRKKHKMTFLTVQFLNSIFSIFRIKKYCIWHIINLLTTVKKKNQVIIHFFLLEYSIFCTTRHT